MGAFFLFSYELLKIQKKRYDEYQIWFCSFPFFRFFISFFFSFFMTFCFPLKLAKLQRIHSMKYMPLFFVYLKFSFFFFENYQSTQKKTKEKEIKIINCHYFPFFSPSFIGFLLFPFIFLLFFRFFFLLFYSIFSSLQK